MFNLLLKNSWIPTHFLSTDSSCLWKPIGHKALLKIFVCIRNEKWQKPCSFISISQRTSWMVCLWSYVTFNCFSFFCIIDAAINLPWQWNIPFKHETGHQLFRANIYFIFFPATSGKSQLGLNFRINSLKLTYKSFSGKFGKM